LMGYAEYVWIHKHLLQETFVKKSSLLSYYNCYFLSKPL
jgi:hypothetical protein